MRIVRTRRGARLEEDGLVVSEVLRRPGPTHSLFDVLAGAAAALAPGPRMALLGFAGGGLIGPLRAMGFGHPVDAVDLSTDGAGLFRELCAPWCGDVRVHRAEASAWLKGSRKRFDVILEDLSARVDGEITKPGVSIDILPALMATRLRPGGIVVLNVLPVPGRPWTRLLPHLAAPYRQARAIVLDDWENRILILGERLEGARDASTRIRRSLRAIGSREAGAFTLRTLS